MGLWFPKQEIEEAIAAGVYKDPVRLVSLEAYIGKDGELFAFWHVPPCKDGGPAFASNAIYAEIAEREPLQKVWMSTDPLQVNWYREAVKTGLAKRVEFHELPGWVQKDLLIEIVDTLMVQNELCTRAGY